jgi:hypothetical protein
MTDPLTLAVDRLVNQVAHWTPVRWTKAADTAGGSRADVVHALVQRLADTSADVAGAPHRAVPRLTNDLALPDQLRVLGRDLASSGAPEPVIEAAITDIRSVAQAL